MPDVYGSQINVRMSSALKEAGDAGLSSIGLTASEAVRSLWELAASGAQSLSTIRNLLGQEREAGAPRADDLQDDPLVEGRALYMKAFEQMGIPYSGEAAICDPADDKDLLKDALVERLAEKGLS